MGCYGLGVSRALQAVVEQNHDKNGIIWPKALAPCAVHIALLDPDKADAQDALQETLHILKALKLDCFIDDRRERPGVKFKDADLLGLPLRLSLGQRDLPSLELMVRKTGAKEKILLKNLSSKLQDAWRDRKA